ncbi:MAG TPA: hypothetical protein DEH78_06965 [Solibacterales bacterium]|nr:hypothetical protein [Bryobacterales bacterium]
MSVAILAALAPQIGGAANPVDPALNVLWERNLGPRYDQALYRWAVCSNGRSYFTDARGRIAALDSDGRVLDDSARHSELIGTVAIACDPQGNLRAVNGGRLLTFSLEGAIGLQSSVDIQKHKLSPSRLLVTPSNSLIVSGSRNGSAFIHVLTEDGALVRSFGEPPAEAPASLSRESARRASIAWDSVNNRLLHVPMNHFDVRAYDPGGRLLARNPKALAEVEPPSLDPLSGRPRPNDEVLSVAALPDGSLALQAAVLAQRSSGKRFRTGVLALLNADLAVVRRIEGPVPGILQGSRADGALYFMSITPGNGIRLIAAKLAE